MKKVLLPTNEVFIKLSEEDMLELNIKPNDKFDLKLEQDGSIKLEKYTSIELDMAEWPREFLEILIKESCERDISVNEVLVDTIKKSIDL